MQQIDYIMEMAPTLEKFHKVGAESFAFRCPICGDSSKNKNKTRGFLLTNNDFRGYRFFCHNCQASYSLYDFTKLYYPDIHKRMIFDKYKSIQEPPKLLKKLVSVPKNQHKFYDVFQRISTLEKNHSAYQYLESRKIPKQWFNILGHSDHFQQDTNNFLPGKFAYLNHDFPRIVIPVFDSAGVLNAFAGRDYTGHSISKYITIKLNDADIMFGVDKLDTSKKFYILEGQFDSMLVENSIAMSGIGKNIDFLQRHLQKAVVILDNDCRNPHVVSMVLKIINLGARVMIWSENYPHKDINDAIMAGVNIDEMMQYIDSRIFKGARALLEFNKWRKVDVYSKR